MSGVLDRMELGLTPVYRRGMERTVLDHGAGTTFAAYDFADYQARYGRQPQSPRYLVSGAAGTVRVWFTRAGGPPEESVDVLVPAGRTAVVPLPGAAASITGTLRLTRFRALRTDPAGVPDAQWRFEALLGNLAKLLWIAGAEHEEVAVAAADVRAQRNAPTAHGGSLDLLGADLSVPRFPPRPYGWDAATVALYHLDEPPGAATVAGERGRHPGTAAGIRTGRPGRFGRAVELAGAGAVTVPDHADFALPAGAPFTVEAMVRPVSTATGTVAGKRSAGAPGWSLALGTFRGVDRNPRLTLSDGVSTVDLFADADLGDGGFHHVAGVLDPPSARLYVDGRLVAEAALGAFGALTNAEPVRIGTGFAGSLDEVRFSSVARTAFHPVVGEGDEAYRRRLAVFQRWLVPTPDALTAALNETAGPVAGNPAPFVVDERTDPLVIGTLPVRVLPAPLPPGGSVAADGDLRAGEASVVGTAGDEDGFDVAWLRRHEDRAGLEFGDVEAHRLMQQGVRAALGRLLDRLGGRLFVVRAYDAGGPGLHAVGRALLLRHETVPPDELAVHAHAAGFAYVRHTPAGEVYAAPAKAEPFLVTAPPAPAGPDVVEGADLVLGLDPDPAAFADATAAWSLVRCGAGAGELRPGPGRSVTLHAVAAGDVAVRAEVTRQRHTGTGSRTVRIGLSDTSLGPNQSIARDGTRDAPEPPAAADFDELYLLTRADDRPGLSYGTDPAHRRMQRVTSAALDRLLARLTGPGVLTVVSAHDPAAGGPAAQGRALRLRHSVLPAPALAARAFAAGLDYVRVEAGAPPSVYVAVAAGEQIGIAGPAEVPVGGSITLTAEPPALPSGVAVSADGARAYVADRGSARVTAFTLAANPPNALPRLALDRSTRVLGDPAAVVAGVVAGAGRVFVAHERPGVVSVLDGVTLAPAGGPVATGARPVALAVAGTRLLVACAGDRTLRAYDTASLAPLGSVVLPGVPRSLAVGPAVYAVLDGDRFCAVAAATLSLGPVVATDTGATHAAVSPDGARLYVSCATAGTVRVYATATNAPAGVVTVAEPGAVAAGGPYVYVTSAARVRVIDGATGTLLPQLFTPGTPTTWLATGPTGAAYAPCLLAVSAPGATVTLGDPAPLAGAPPRSPRVVASIALGSGDGEHLAWATVPFSRGRVSLSSLVRPAVRVTGAAAGTTLVRLVSVRGEHLLPYQFEVRLVPALDANPAVEISKEQYDLVMNVLNRLHPIGVEVRTDRIRAHVVELRDAGADLSAGYTYPAYRLPHVLRRAT